MVASLVAVIEHGQHARYPLRVANAGKIQPGSVSVSIHAVSTHESEIKMVFPHTG